MIPAFHRMIIAIDIPQQWPGRSKYNEEVSICEQFRFVILPLCSRDDQDKVGCMTGGGVAVISDCGD